MLIVDEDSEYQFETGRPTNNFTSTGWQIYSDDVWDSEESPEVFTAGTLMRIVSDEVVPLRTLEVKIGNCAFQGVLDNGSSIICMSKDAWMATGLHLDQSKAINMEVA